MKECFIPKTFNIKHQHIINTANSILANMRRQGYDLSLRQLYYQFVAHHAHLLNSDPVKQNTEQSYKMLGSIISDARDAGAIDWSFLVDRGRDISDTDWGYGSPADALRTTAQGYRELRWETQPYKVIVMVEKQALEGVIQPVCARYRVVFGANKGYSSSSAMYGCGQTIKEALDEDKNVRVIYLGDHDPSGIDMSRDVTDRLAMYSGAGRWVSDPYVFDLYDLDKPGVVMEPEFEDRFEVVRIALNMDQVRKYGPPPNPTKVDDSRAAGYMARFGSDCWELDALEPSVIAGLVESNIRAVIDWDAWGICDAHEKKCRRYLNEVADNYIEPDDTDTPENDQEPD